MFKDISENIFKILLNEQSVLKKDGKSKFWKSEKKTSQVVFKNQKEQFIK